MKIETNVKQRGISMSYEDEKVLSSTHSAKNTFARIRLQIMNTDLFAILIKRLNLLREQEHFAHLYNGKEH